MNNKETVNSCEEIWKRIVKNQGRILSMSRRPGTISYKVINNDSVKWISQNNDQNNLFDQSKTQICECIEARRENLGVSQYPGTAASYKWALLNDPRIWID
tara:strand:- start:1969 stop:2271 length:303 start_codon:yes stop_codon:yes gene_type:complete